MASVIAVMSIKPSCCELKEVSCVACGRNANHVPEISVYKPMADVIVNLVRCHCYLVVVDFNFKCDLDCLLRAKLQHNY
jgi:hypothetical protein